MKKFILALTTAATLSVGSLYTYAADYAIDDKGAHAFINFKVKHLGYSWLTGRFNTFSGTFSYDDKNVNASKVTVDIDVNSIDSNHAKRDKHLRADDYLHTKKYSKAKFVSTSITDKGSNQLEVVGDFTLMGVTKSITIDAEKIGEGKDPWGGYRAGFSGTTALSAADFGLPKKLGDVLLELHIEGIRQ